MLTQVTYPANGPFDVSLLLSQIMGFKIPESFKMQFFKRSPQKISWSSLGHMSYISLNYRWQKKKKIEKIPSACFAILLIFQGYLKIWLKVSRI